MRESVRGQGGGGLAPFFAPRFVSPSLISSHPFHSRLICDNAKKKEMPIERHADEVCMAQSPCIVRKKCLKKTQRGEEEGEEDVEKKMGRQFAFGEWANREMSVKMMVSDKREKERDRFVEMSHGHGSSLLQLQAFELDCKAARQTTYTQRS